MQQQSQNQRVKPVENRFNRAARKLRNLHVSIDTREIQQDIEWQRRDIIAYGFEFFPNHYIYDRVKEFEFMVDSLSSHLSTQHK
jgi:hypothetical protein